MTETVVEIEEVVNETNVFIAYRCPNKTLNFLAVENGVFYRLRNNILQPLSNKQTMVILIGISKKENKVVGFGRYGQKLKINKDVKVVDAV